MGVLGAFGLIRGRPTNIGVAIGVPLEALQSQTRWDLSLDWLGTHHNWGLLGWGWRAGRLVGWLAF